MILPSNYIWYSWCKTFTHSAKATSICSTSEKQIPAKTNSRYRNISSPVQNCLYPPVKYENKFQSQNNHDSFNCRPSKSNPHSINQKSVIFGMHKTHPQSAYSTNATSHHRNGYPAIYTFTPPFDVATLANPKTPQRSPEWRYGLVSKDCNQHMHWNSWSQWIYVWIHLQQYFDCNSSQWKILSLKSQALMTSDTDTKSTPEKSPEIEISCIDDTWHR